MPPTKVSPVVVHLAREQANATELYLRYKGYHWNVKGPQFHDLHRLFDEHASVVLETIDALAERQRMLGAPAEYSLSALRERSALPAEVGPLPDTPEMLRRLLVGHRVILEGMRQGFKAAEAAEDPGTADLFARFLQAHEKMEWFLRELMT